MKRIERDYIEKVLKDCKMLKKNNDLTEYGNGQMQLCKILLKLK